MLQLYRLITWLISPLIPIYLRGRVKAGKEEQSRIKERYGYASLPKFDKPLIWVHAASMGEVQSVMPFIKRINNEYPNIYILLTTVTTSSAKHFAKQLPEKVVHQYAPLDTPNAVRRFLQHWQPQAAFFVDSELWPNMLAHLRQSNVPSILLNGRISDKSFKKWHLAKGLCAQMLQSFTYIFAKSDDDARRFAMLGAVAPLSYGNLKFASPALNIDGQSERILAEQIAERPLWLAASTHAGEEQIIAETHLVLRKKYPHLLTIIVPRHSNRGDEIKMQLEQMGLKVAQRSKGEIVTSSIDIYLGDTMGELGLFYALSEIAFIGGSLVPHGGQNPLEAARLGCAIIYGNHMHNFREFCQVLEHNKAAIMVQNAQELQQNIDNLLENPEIGQEMSVAALQIIEQNQNVLDDIMAKLKPLLKQFVA
jgi:3-deoxy-D-manno-octulosonic-acid transferase